MENEPELIVATGNYLTTWLNVDGNPDGTPDSLHVVVFATRGEARVVRLDSTTSHVADAWRRHATLVSDSANWRHHGVLPEHARRVASRGQVVPLNSLKVVE